ncbi:hypothetical protein Nepgr_033617 [Nepenthes gracilis]|uniref:Uncharacterized protein n=1 Tax=Nepenthes gracilis TaxID=150966 RepID=A0AAD3TKY4_NEPGR|nr:hypothetical protein Nepgr_033617 [Nepenthes gracilis]
MPNSGSKEDLAALKEVDYAYKDLDLVEMEFDNAEQSAHESESSRGVEEFSSMKTAILGAEGSDASMPLNMKLEFPSRDSARDYRFAALLMRDDANRLNAGSFLFEALVLFWLAEGKQLSFVGNLACMTFLGCRGLFSGMSMWCAPSVVLCPGSLSAPHVGFGLSAAVPFCAELAGVGGAVILMMPVFGSGDPELDVLDVNACFPGPLGDLAVRRLADLISCWFIAAPAVLGLVGWLCFYVVCFRCLEAYSNSSICSHVLCLVEVHLLMGDGPYRAACYGDVCPITDASTSFVLLLTALGSSWFLGFHVEKAADVLAVVDGSSHAEPKRCLLYLYHCLVVRAMLLLLAPSG